MTNRLKAKLDPSAAVRELIRDMKAVAGPGFKTTLAKMETEVERLSTEVELLRMVNAEPCIENMWAKYELTRTEGMIMNALERAGDKGITRDSLIRATHAAHDINDWPDTKIIDIYVCKIRKKLAAHNIPCWIETIWGEGYRLRKEPLPARIAAGTGDRRTRYIRRATQDVAA